VNQTNRKRKTTYKRAKKRPTTNKRTKKQSANNLSGVVLPQSGDKSVAGEAFAKLDSAQQTLVKEKVNKKTNKQVSTFYVNISLPTN
jgi:hypothetical protein